MPFTAEELRNLAVPGTRDDDSEPALRYRPHGLSERFGAKKVQDVVGRYEAGESARSIAERYGVSTSAVINLLRDNAVVVIKRRLSDAETQKLAKEYDAGATMAELQKKYGLSHGVVSRALHKVGVKMRARAPRRKLGQVE